MAVISTVILPAIVVDGRALRAASKAEKLMGIAVTKGKARDRIGDGGERGKLELDFNGVGGARSLTAERSTTRSGFWSSSKIDSQRW